MVQAVQERCAELETEAAVLSEELTRTSAVAARATAREVVNGSKDEGVVPVTLHIEEVRLACFFFPASFSLLLLSCFYFPASSSVLLLPPGFVKE